MTWEINEIKGDIMAKVSSLTDLDEYAKEGGWDDAQNFLMIYDISFEELKDKWFCVIGGRLYIE